MKKDVCVFLFLFAILLSASAWAGKYARQGTLDATVRCEFSKQVKIGADVQKASLSFVVPQDFKSSRCLQKISDFNLDFSPVPQEMINKVDARGNNVITASWNNAPAVIDVHMTYNVKGETKLNDLGSKAPFPLVEVDPDAKDYLKATKQIQADDRRIRELSASLTGEATTASEAVRQVILYVVGHMNYVTPP